MKKYLYLAVLLLTLAFSVGNAQILFNKLSSEDKSALKTILIEKHPGLEVGEDNVMKAAKFCADKGFATIQACIVAHKDIPPEPKVGNHCKSGHTCGECSCLGGGRGCTASFGSCYCDC